MHTETDDSVRVAVPAFPLGEDHTVLSYNMNNDTDKSLLGDSNSLAKSVCSNNMNNDTYNSHLGDSTSLKASSFSHSTITNDCETIQSGHSFHSNNSVKD